MNQNNAITPILICPEDLDFSCIVIVADVIKTDDKVIWRKIGMVNHSNESFEQEKRSGILYVDSYTKEDWELYGDNIALTDVDSPEWRKWVGDNWNDELDKDFEKMYKEYGSFNFIEKIMEEHIKEPHLRIAQKALARELEVPILLLSQLKLILVQTLNDYLILLQV